MTDLKALGRMLVIVPHQDDEILLSAGIILRAVRENLPIDVCVVTNGDYGCLDRTIGHMRLRETLNGLEYLGLTSEHVIFLGYADTGMPESESFLCRLLASERDEVIASRCGNETYALPGKRTWHSIRFGREAPYCQKSLRDDLHTLLDELKPDTIFTTSLFDLHGDHSALCRFVMAAAACARPRATLYQGVVHSLGGDENWPVRDGETPITLPGGVRDMEAVRFSMPEDMWDESFSENRKLHALRCHVSAMKPDAVDFLSAFVKADELFFRAKENEHA